MGSAGRLGLGFEHDHSRSARRRAGARWLDCVCGSRTRGDRASPPCVSRPDATSSTSANSRSAASSSVLLRIIDDPADVEIDVVGHLLRRPGVASDLDDRRDRVARRRAEPGREDHDLRSTAHHPGDRLDIQPRGVHHGQPFARDPPGILDDVAEWRALAAFVRGAQRLLLDRRQSPANIARGRLRAADIQS